MGGWDKWNQGHWLANYPDFAEHFVANLFLTYRPSRSKMASNGPTRPMVKSRSKQCGGATPPSFDISEACIAKKNCPVLMIHCDNDQIGALLHATLIAEL